MGDGGVSVLIPTYRRPDALAATLERWAAVDPPPGGFELIVVDDAGGDRATAAAVAKVTRPGFAPLLLSQKHAGAAAARNLGAQNATRRLLLFCDDDILVEPTHLARHLATHADYPDSCVMGWRDFSPAAIAAMKATTFGRYWLNIVKGWEARLGTSGLADGEHALDDVRILTDDLASYDLSMPASVFEALDGFDAAYPSGTLEDHDFSLRASAAGIRLIRQTNIRVLHDHPTTSLSTACRREEVRAEAAVVLARRHPTRAPQIEVVREHAGGSDVPLRMRLRGNARLVLSRDPILASAQAAARLLEGLRVPDRWLAPLFRATIALHITRGARTAARRFSQLSPHRSLL